MNCDPDRMVQLLDKLVNNAVEHGEKEYPVVLRVNKDKKSVLLEVTDIGDSLDPNAKIFEPFISGKARSIDQGFGLGLYVVKKIPDAVRMANSGQIAFTIMAKRRVSNIVTERNGFDEILIQPQKSPYGSGNFGDQLNM